MSITSLVASCLFSAAAMTATVHARVFSFYPPPRHAVPSTYVVCSAAGGWRAAEGFAAFVRVNIILYSLFFSPTERTDVAVAFNQLVNLSKCARFCEPRFCSLGHNFITHYYFSSVYSFGTYLNTNRKVFGNNCFFQTCVVHIIHIVIFRHGKFATPRINVQFNYLRF